MGLKQVVALMDLDVYMHLTLKLFNPGCCNLRSYDFLFAEPAIFILEVGLLQETLQPTCILITDNINTNTKKNKYRHTDKYKSFLVYILLKVFAYS